MTRRTIALTALCAVFSLAPRPAHGAEAGFFAIAGMGLDWETGVDMPVRCLAGLGLSYGPLDLAMSFDYGFPWEPAALLDADLSVLDLEAVRLNADGAVWLRAVGSIAAETGMRIGARAEIGPRFLALVAAGGWSVSSTRFSATDASLSDSAPWAHLGVLWRPVDTVHMELAIASDTSEAIWLRTSFELSGSWEPVPGIRIDGLLGWKYSDFFTLTSYLDGIEARVSVRLPVGRIPS